MMPGWVLNSSPGMLVWLRVYANHSWSVTEPEAVGVPGWQKGTKALCQCNALHTIQGPVQTVYDRESGALNWPFWEVFQELNLASLKSLLSTTTILWCNFRNGWLDFHLQDVVCFYQLPTAVLICKLTWVLFSEITQTLMVVMLYIYWCRNKKLIILGKCVGILAVLLLRWSLSE